MTDLKKIFKPILNNSKNLEFCIEFMSSTGRNNYG